MTLAGGEDKVLTTVEHLGKYQLDRRLATGGMAELFLARHSGPGGFEKTVVIKRLFQNLAESQELVDMFLQEARIAARLNHPNCVQIYDLGEEDGQYFIAMEYIQGPDLMAIQRRARRMGQPIPMPLAVYIMSLVCRGLHHAHELRDGSGKKYGLVHRDVSPHNVLVTYNGDVKLVDFGVAKATTHAAATQAGVLKGKFAYMSPEHCDGAPLDARADVFSAGILLHELLTRRRLFRRNTDFATMRAVMEDAVPLPSSLVDDIPAGLDEAAIKCLDRSRDQRHQSAQELQLALEATIRESGWRTGPLEVAAYINEIFPDHDTPYGKSGTSSTGQNEDSDVVQRPDGSLLGSAVIGIDETRPDGPQGLKASRSESDRIRSFLEHSTVGATPEMDEFDAPTVAVADPEQAFRETGDVPIEVPPPAGTGFDNTDIDAATIAATPSQLLEEARADEGAPLIASTQPGGRPSEETTQELDEREVMFSEDEHTIEAPPRALDMALSADMSDAKAPPPTPGLRRADSGRLGDFDLPAGPLQSMTSLDTPPDGLPLLRDEPVDHDPSLQQGHLPAHGSGLMTVTTGTHRVDLGEGSAEEKSRWLITVGVLVALFVGMGIALVVLLTQGIKEGATDTGFLIHSDPAGAEVYVDGRKQFGQTPVRVMGLTKDKKHWIVVRMKGYRPFQRQLASVEGTEQLIRAKLQPIAGKAQGSAEVNISAPEGAQVYVDGTLRGITPLRLRDVSTDKKHVIIVRKKGFKEHTEKLEALLPGQKLNLMVKLVAEQKGASAPEK